MDWFKHLSVDHEIHLIKNKTEVATRPHASFKYFPIPKSDYIVAIRYSDFVHTPTVRVRPDGSGVEIADEHYTNGLVLRDGKCENTYCFANENHKRSFDYDWKTCDHLLNTFGKDRAKNIENVNAGTHRGMPIEQAAPLLDIASKKVDSNWIEGYGLLPLNTKNELDKIAKGIALPPARMSINKNGGRAGNTRELVRDCYGQYKFLAHEINNDRHLAPGLEPQFDGTGKQ